MAALGGRRPRAYQRLPPTLLHRLRVHMQRTLRWGGRGAVCACPSCCHCSCSGPSASSLAARHRWRGGLWRLGARRSPTRPCRRTLWAAASGLDICRSLWHEGTRMSRMSVPSKKHLSVRALCSPLKGQGIPQLETTQIFVSSYLDRLLAGERAHTSPVQGDRP